MQVVIHKLKHLKPNEPGESVTRKMCLQLSNSFAFTLKNYTNIWNSNL